MKVSESQLEVLKAFTIKHYVEWVDLQMELVDHLANGIETQWAENPSLTFEECLEKEFKKFGIFGFMDVVENRRNALEKKYLKLISMHFRTFFSLPKIISTFFLVFLVFQIIKNQLFGGYSSDIVISVYGISLITFLFYTIWESKKNKDGEKWLFKEMIFGRSKLFSLGILPIQILGYLSDSSIAIFVLLFSFLFVSILLIIYIMLFEIPAKADKYLTETYPEYKFYQKL